MTSRISEAFSKAAREERPAFVAYVVAGYPTLAEAVDVLLELEKGGVDLIELGIPFTDPLADGPTIQAAHITSLENGTDIDSSMQLVADARIRGLNIPVVFMGYYNPIMQYGEELLVERCAQAGIDGYIVVDLPPEEAVSFRGLCATLELSYIPLITPSTSEARIKRLVQIADSFIYIVSRSGVTGARKYLDTHLPELLGRVQQHSSLPLAVGFGVNTHAHFKDVGAMADSVVIGSQFITVMKNASPGKAAEAARRYAEEVSGRTVNDTKRAKPLPKFGGAHATDCSETQSLLPDRFGDFGGQYIPEALYDCVAELEEAYVQCKDDPAFWEEFRSFYPYMGRPSPLHLADRLTSKCGGARIFLKREDLCHTGSHKLNNAIGQALVAKRLGKTRIIAETGAGQHGVGTATICAKLGLQCIIYMGSEDMRRQALNVFRIRMLGAEVIPATTGSCTLKDAVNEAMRDWVTNVQSTHYLVGSAIGCHPFPTMVRVFQCVIGNETKEQMQALTGRLPDAVVACVGGGSNSIGMFYPFISDKSVRLVGAEAAGDGVDTPKHSATISSGTLGVFHGAKTYLLQDKKGQIMETHSISAGLDYPGVGPEHAWLRATGRGEYHAVTDTQALEGFRNLTQLEGIIPALESSHAVYQAMQVASKMSPEQQIVICVSGRGDKDVNTVAEVLPVIGPRIGWDLRFEEDPTKIPRRDNN
ncbi:tryptophan synthase [Coemansia reversa NRRL 1564]|uniref:Tryptophan synthase n=1 Tax=Coemansia reversa (strain ATCC 12441 / NRRL 1564) TaxID=763665 RepID=A0A2G5B4R2_COERN|nr:tryptophan synthase [Coemansia reversa NRRL 1564]|eukprot:PIA13981.1 tryptophan synthase [Coemansia reversa NRRL 1564]